MKIAVPVSRRQSVSPKMLKLAVTLALLAVAVHASNPPPNMQGGFSTQMFFNELPWGRNNRKPKRAL